LVYVGGGSWHFTSAGSLSDIAPTLLTLMGMEVPADMTGRVLMSL
jgi:2,3-bisphosphoglycerate-independent phosphoglycerate mutase